MRQIAQVTGWGFKEIMEELPFSAGLQIIDAELYAQGIPRLYTREATPDFDLAVELKTKLETLR